MRLVLAAAALLTSACGPPDETQRTVEFDPDRFSRLDLRLDVGDVVLVPGDVAELMATLRWRGEVSPELESRLAGGTLLVSLACPEQSRACAGDVEVTVPEGTEIDLVDGVGNVDVEGFAGPLDLAVGEGRVVATGTTGDLRVDVSAGTIVLDAVGGRFNVQTTTGNISGTGLSALIGEAASERGAIDLSFDAPPDLADLSTLSGDIGVSLPAGEYDVDVTSRRGSVSVQGIDNTSNASSVVLARSTAGNIDVEGR